MKDIYNKEYFQWDEKVNLELKQMYYRLIINSLVERFHPQIALDIGCGTGGLVSALREQGVSAVGFDISTYALCHALEGAAGYLLRADADSGRLPFKDNAFDVITAHEVIEHIHNLDSLVSEMKRLAKTVFITTPTPPIPERIWCIMARIRNSPIHVNTHTRVFWIKLFEKHGFTYVGDIHEVVKRAAYLNVNPTSLRIGNILMKFGKPGHWAWSNLAGYIRGSFLFTT